MVGQSEAGVDPLAALTHRRAAMWRTYPALEARVLFVQVNKNACTSLKWMMAQLAGEDLSAFGPSLAPSTGDEDDIHDRRQWRRAPRLDELDPAVRAGIHPDNGWFVFAVTRDPWARLFSAWQSKLLLDNPGYTRYRGEAWYPRHPVTAASVARDFAAFVELLVGEPDHRLHDDAHFSPQVSLLHEDVVSYTEIYDVRDLGRLQADLRRHLEAVGWTGELTLPRLNDTPLRANRQVFAGGVDAMVQKLYAADLERFPGRWDSHDVADDLWTPDQLAEVERRASLGRRLGHLRDQALAFRAEAAAERRRADRLQQRVRRLRGRLDAGQAPRGRAAGTLGRRLGPLDPIARRARGWLTGQPSRRPDGPEG